MADKQATPQPVERATEHNPSRPWAAAAWWSPRLSFWMPYRSTSQASRLHLPTLTASFYIQWMAIGT